jgi:hypothetical protein
LCHRRGAHVTHSTGHGRRHRVRLLLLLLLLGHFRTVIISITTPCRGVNVPEERRRLDVPWTRQSASDKHGSMPLNTVPRSRTQPVSS